ncbi:hypothetical protein [Acidaminococcus sp.]|uniref:hypothetical protein n=1 Tax=Acidaminococcus sp. TaxID=1872103 RepID=UPI003D7C5685
MSNTNVAYYIAGFDNNGKRVGSLICDFDPAKDADKLADLKTQAQELFTDAAIIEPITAADYNAYLSGMIRGTDGKPIAYVAPEPTDEEKKAAQKTALKTEYESGRAELLDSLQAAQLSGNADAVASIQAEYKEFAEAYKAAVEEVG